MFGSYYLAFVQPTRWSVTVKSKKKICYCCVFQNRSAERQSTESFCASSCEVKSEWVRKPCRISHNRLRDQEAHGRWRRCQQMCRQWSKDCCPSNGTSQAVLRIASHKRSSLSNAIPQAVTIHNSLSTTACASVDTFAIIHAPLNRVDGCARHPEIVCDLTHFVSLRSDFKIHNNNKSFYSMSQSQSIGWVKQKLDNNYQTTRIVTKDFVTFFSVHPVLHVRPLREIYIGLGSYSMVSYRHLKFLTLILF